MKLKKESKRKTWVGSLLGLIGLIIFSGCAFVPKVILHPIAKQHIYVVEKGVQCGDQVTEEEGFFISDFYLEEVMKAKVK